MYDKVYDSRAHINQPMVGKMDYITILKHAEGQEVAKEWRGMLASWQADKLRLSTYATHITWGLIKLLKEMGVDVYVCFSSTQWHYTHAFWDTEDGRDQVST